MLPQRRGREAVTKWQRYLDVVKASSQMSAAAVGPECSHFSLAADVKNSKLATARSRSGAVHPFKARAGRKKKRGKVVNSQLSLASLFAVVVCWITACYHSKGGRGTTARGFWPFMAIKMLARMCRWDGGREGEKKGERERERETVPAATADQKQIVNRWAWRSSERAPCLAREINTALSRTWSATSIGYKSVHTQHL